MTGGAVNMNRFRKAKKRAEKQATADENRVKFGRTKAEKARDAAGNEKMRRTVDGARRVEDE
ncbi:MAG: DUF4169 family protein [Proteobacteria bacterium]|nr:DUF4169 family protein [Pseudomonadota bacterium]